MTPEEEQELAELEELERLEAMDAQQSQPAAFNPAEFYSDRSNLVPDIAPGAIARTGGEIIGGGIGGIVGGLGGGAAGAAGAPVVGGVTGAGTGYAIGGIPGAIMGGLAGTGAGLAFGAPAGAITGAATGSGVGAHYGRKFGDVINSALGLDTLSPEEQPSLGLDLGLGLVGEAAVVGKPLAQQAWRGVRNPIAAAANAMAPEAASRAALQDPAVQTAVGFVQRNQGDYYASQIDQLPLPSRVNPQLRSGVEAVQFEVSNNDLPTLIAQQLGASADKSAATIGAGIQFKRGVEELVNAKFFDKFNSLDEAVDAIRAPGGLMESVNVGRATLALELDKALAGVNPPWTKPENLRGVYSGQKLAPLLKPLDDRIAEYSIIPGNEAKIEAMKRARADFLNKSSMVGSANRGLVPSQMIEMDQAYNLYRRQRQEFLVQNTGKMAQGQARPMDDIVGEIEAIGFIQDALDEGLAKSVDEIVSIRPGLKIKADDFSRLNAEQAAYKGFEQMASRFQQETMRGSPLTQRSAANLVQTSGPGQFASNVGSGKAGLIRGAVDYIGKKAGARTTTDAQETLAATAKHRAWRNIQDLIKLKQNPASMGDAPQFSFRPPYEAPGMSRFAAGGVAGQLGYDALAPGEAQAQEELFTPSAPIKVSINPVLPEPKQGFQLPRNLSALDPQGVANMIGVMMPPQLAEPLLIQWRKVSQGGTKEQQAEFIGLLVDRYPDFPIQRGPITGLNSEFDIGDGQMRLFSFNDKVKWEDQINNSPLETDEKAQRVLSLRKSGVVVPNNVKLAPQRNPAEVVTPQNRAMDHLMKTHQFSPREDTGMGSRRME